jgi:2-oxoisovalerate dehydrogenase E1 component alpha subunit
MYSYINDVAKALEVAELKNKPPLQELFNDVYESKPQHLIKQEQALLEHIKKYPDHYNHSH